MYAYMDGCMYVCMHVCMYVCMYVCVCIMYVRIYAYTNFGPVGPFELGFGPKTRPKPAPCSSKGLECLSGR